LVKEPQCDLQGRTDHDSPEWVNQCSHSEKEKTLPHQLPFIDYLFFMSNTTPDAKTSVQENHHQLAFAMPVKNTSICIEIPEVCRVRTIIIKAVILLARSTLYSW
jgi:hypothetical protein